MKTNKTLLTLAVAASLASVPTLSHAAGFQLAEYSATGLGRAYAGEAAMADNASAQWRNPAMLTYLNGTQVSTGAIYVNPNLDVEGNVEFYGKNIRTESNDFANDAIVPNLYLSNQINDKLFVGLAFGTNYGMETSLSSDFSANHFGNEAMVKSVEINPNLAYRMTETISVGGGVRYVMGEGHFGAQTASNNYVATTPTLVSMPKGTTLKYMEGTDNAWGWQAGAAWQINSSNRIGFTCKSEVDLKLTGHAEGIGFGLSAGSKDNGYMVLTLPATAEIASFHQVTDKIALHGSINWTDWSSFEKLEAELDKLGTQMVKEENWKDNYRFALGATYQLDSKLALRSGVAYDMGAVSDQNRTITIPETDRIWLSIGAGYDVTEQFTVDAGFTYIIAKDASIKESRGYESDDKAAAVGGTFTGQTTGSVWLLGVQASYRF